MIKKLSLKALEQAINLAMNLDDNSQERIAALHGKIIEMIIMPLGIHFFIGFENGRITLDEQCEQKPDTIIHSSPIGLIRLSLLPASKARSLFNDRIRLSGDIELGQQVKKLIDDLDIDWEGHLAQFTGDVIAHQVGSVFKQGLAFHQRFGLSMRNNLTNYLQEETRIFPPREECEDFYQDIDQLVMDTDRLEAQINLLTKNHESD